MLSDVDIVRMAAGANSVTVASSGDGVTLQTPGASIQVTGAGEISVDGGGPVSKSELNDAFQHVQALKVVDDAGNKVGSVTVANGKAEMELNGEAVPTVRQQAANAFLSSLNWTAFTTLAGTPILNKALADCVNGDYAFVDLSSCSPALANVPFYRAPDAPLLRGTAPGAQHATIRMGEGVSGLKRMTLKMENSYRSASGHLMPYNEDVDFVVLTKSFGLFGFEAVDSTDFFCKAKSLTVISTNATSSYDFFIWPGYITTSNARDTRLPEDNLNFPIKFIAPCFTGSTSFYVKSRSSGNWMTDDASKPTHLDITASMPSYVSSFSFYKSNFNSPENLVYLMDNLGTPAPDSSPELTFGIDAALVDGERASTPPVYSDATLQAAVERFRAKGWVDMPIPVTEE